MQTAQDWRLWAQGRVGGDPYERSEGWWMRQFSQTPRRKPRELSKAQALFGVGASKHRLGTTRPRDWREVKRQTRKRTDIDRARNRRKFN